MARLFYFCPDNARPSGGIRTIYRHVDLLNQAGFSATVVHETADFRYGWNVPEVPVTSFTALPRLTAADWLILPETTPLFLWKILKNRPAQKAVFCQNHYYIFDHLPPGQSWRDYGVTELIGSSQQICHFLQHTFAWTAHYVPYDLHHAVYRPGPDKRALSLCFMPRKGQTHLATAQAILWHRQPHLRTIAWHPIDQLSESAVADRLQRSTFFLFTGCREGFGLPPVEAMACGAIVIGFPAGGGRDFATEKNGFWVPDEDSLALAARLEETLLAYQATPHHPRWASLRESGYATARRYDTEAERSALLAFWQSKIPGPRKTVLP